MKHENMPLAEIPLRSFFLRLFCSSSDCTVPMSLAEDSRADQQAEEYLIIWDHIREGENLISFVLFNHLQLYLVLWNVHETCVIFVRALQSSIAQSDWDLGSLEATPLNSLVPCVTCYNVLGVLLPFCHGQHWLFWRFMLHWLFCGIRSPRLVFGTQGWALRRPSSCNQFMPTFCITFSTDASLRALLSYY